ncbi:MAG: hypothetical protein KBD01_20035, partial [Acidobacteria bacterium]|nr:hypothetical protein [Acidobacteriota bacterium]
MNARTRILAAAAAFALAAGVGAARATDATVTITSPAGAVSKTLPGGSGTFALDVPLAKNAVNRITVAAADDLGHSATRELSITQVSLDSIVVAQVT